MNDGVKQLAVEHEVGRMTMQRASDKITVRGYCRRGPFNLGETTSWLLHLTTYDLPPKPPTSAFILSSALVLTCPLSHCHYILMFLIWPTSLCNHSASPSWKYDRTSGESVTLIRPKYPNPCVAINELRLYTCSYSCFQVLDNTDTITE